MGKQRDTSRVCPGECCHLWAPVSSEHPCPNSIFRRSALSLSQPHPPSAALFDPVPLSSSPPQADAAPKKKSFRKYSYRGVDLENLLVMPMAELMDLVHARARRRYAPSPPLPLLDLSSSHSSLCRIWATVHSLWLLTQAFRFPSLYLNCGVALQWFTGKCFRNAGCVLMFSPCSFKHGLKRKYYALLKRLRAAKKGVNAAAQEKPDCIKTHLRNMIILPEVTRCHRLTLLSTDP